MRSCRCGSGTRDRRSPPGGSAHDRHPRSIRGRGRRGSRPTGRSRRRSRCPTGGRGSRTPRPAPGRRPGVPHRPSAAGGRHRNRAPIGPCRRCPIGRGRRHGRGAGPGSTGDHGHPSRPADDRRAGHRPVPHGPLRRPVSTTPCGAGRADRPTRHRTSPCRCGRGRPFRHAGPAGPAGAAPGRRSGAAFGMVVATVPSRAVVPGTIRVTHLQRIPVRAGAPSRRGRVRAGSSAPRPVCACRGAPPATLLAGARPPPPSTARRAP